MVSSSFSKYWTTPLITWRCFNRAVVHFHFLFILCPCQYQICIGKAVFKCHVFRNNSSFIDRVIIVTKNTYFATLLSLCRCTLLCTYNQKFYIFLIVSAFCSIFHSFCFSAVLRLEFPLDLPPHSLCTGREEGAADFLNLTSATMFLIRFQRTSCPLVSPP